MTDKEIKTAAAISMLNDGISLPLYLFGKKRPVRVTVKMPTFGSLIRIGKLYEQLGVTAEEYEAYNDEQKMRFVYLHGKDISRMIAYCVVKGRLANRITAWIMRETMNVYEIYEAFKLVIGSINTSPFGNIIRYVENTNRLEPTMERS